MSGPDRIYQEIYDLDPTGLNAREADILYDNCCDYYFGFESLGQIGWGVKITQNVPGKDPNAISGCWGSNCPTNQTTPNYKGTTDT